MTAALWVEMSQFLAEYWHDVDRNAGRRAHEHFTLDGVMKTSLRTYTGRNAIRAFYEGRQSDGERTARHLVTNLRIIEGTPNNVQAEWILSLHADNGAPVLVSAPPIMIADVTDICTRAAAGHWLLQSRAIVPIFKGGVPTTG